jgi:hypothetical protein
MSGERNPLGTTSAKTLWLERAYNNDRARDMNKAVLVGAKGAGSEGYNRY